MRPRQVLIQAVVVFVAVCTAEWVFQVSGGSWIRVALVLPMFPDAVVGLAMSGHGGDMVAAFAWSIGINYLIWLVV